MLRFYKLGLGIIAVVFTLVYAGCTQCEADGEPTAEIIFMYPTNFTQVYGLKDDITVIAPSGTDSWTVPISISNDQTTIIFKTESTTDTLTLAYERIVKQQSHDCGMRIFFENVRIAEPTSFDVVYLVEKSSGDEIAQISIQNE